MSKSTLKGEYRQLNLDDLAKGMPAITPSCGQSMAEAGAVSLEKQKHNASVDLKVKFDGEHSFLLCWTPTTQQVRLCHADPQVAVEHGACALSLLLVRELTEFSVVERSVKTTGIDYWLGLDDDLFQRKARLEVSGIGKGDKSQVQARVKAKIRQTMQSDATKLPAFIAVVEFGTPVAELVKR